MRVAGGRWIVLFVIAAGLVPLAAYAPSFGRSTSFVVRGAGLAGTHPLFGLWRGQSVAEAAEQVPSRHGPMPARWYRPGRSTRAVLLVPGVNALGIDEPRLVAFARELAASGLTVLTVGTPDLRRYVVSARTTDMIEDAAGWLSARSAGIAGGRIGMMGVSFAGALSVVAAGRPSVRDRVAFVFSFGGHADFLNVLRFLCTGVVPLGPGSPEEAGPGEKRVPGGIWRAPHDYGVAVLALDLADRLVPPDQVEALREGIVTFLQASHLQVYDQKAAAVVFERARALGAALPQPAAAVMREVNERDVAALGPRLLPFTAEYASDSALSPLRSPAPSAPVYLLHGRDDQVIPARETLLLARYLRDKTTVHALLSTLISHAEIDRRPTVGEVWRLVAFWASLFRQ